MESILTLNPVWPDFEIQFQSNGVISQWEQRFVRRFVRAQTWLRLQDKRTGLHYFVSVVENQDLDNTFINESIKPIEPANLFNIKQKVLRRLTSSVYQAQLHFKFTSDITKPLPPATLIGVIADEVNPLVPNEVYFKHGNPHLMFNK